ncbi:MAG TPA: hypothetical protein VFA07_04965 [Chthonomonadaceae bacterium]|nr:hypothetical protein [Chthonomonadaceae bacterium]
MSGGIELIPLLLLGAAYFLEEERHKQAKKEEAKREAASEAERQRRREAQITEMEALRGRTMMQLREAYVQSETLLAPDAEAIRKRCDALMSALQVAQDEIGMEAAAGDIPLIYADLAAAARRKRWRDQDRTNSNEVVRLQARLADLEREIESGPPGEAMPFDVSGRFTAHSLLAGIRAGLEAGDLQAAQRGLEQAEEALRAHTQTLAEERKAQRLRQAEAAHAYAEIHALVAGLKADGMVMRWHARAVAEMEAQAGKVQEAGAPAAVLEEARKQADRLVAEANAAQLKADQRDYIARGIATSLADMGFVVSAPAAEHPGHPASATVLQAASATGKSIAVSVPVEGKIWYEVDGYPRVTEAAVGGGECVACDEAEQVLTEMHARLEEAFQVHCGEITWEGKDPQRRMRKADELPSSEGKQVPGGSW